MIDYQHRYQDIKTKGFFKCPKRSCNFSWLSNHTWIRIDLCSQEIRYFGQTCPSLQNHQKEENCLKAPLCNMYVFPADFPGDRVLKLCKKAVNRK